MPVEIVHERMLLNPAEWLRSADSLYSSALIFEPLVEQYWQSNNVEKKQIEHHLKTSMMIMGFAFENLFKALIVLNQLDDLKENFKKKPELPRDLKSHDLGDLAKKAGLEISDSETTDLLDKLTRHSVWAGRYSCPIKAEYLPAKDLFALNSSLIPLTAFCSSDWMNFKILFECGRSIFEKKK